jgi:nicotinamide mononucleotide (NMN) deamidase PncC
MFNFPNRSRERFHNWMDLYFYNEEKVKKDKLNKLIQDTIEAPVKIEDLESGETKGGVISAEIIDLKQNSSNFFVEPIVSYSFF